jgi:hypothetical protein
MKIEMFKGKPILVLCPGTDEEFRLGIRKAKTVLLPTSQVELKRFILEHDKQTAPVVAQQPDQTVLNLTKQMEAMAAQLAALTTPKPAQPKSEPAGRFAAAA